MSWWITTRLQRDRLPDATETGTLTSARSGALKTRPEAKPRARQDRSPPARPVRTDVDQRKKRDPPRARTPQIPEASSLANSCLSNVPLLSCGRIQKQRTAAGSDERARGTSPRATGRTVRVAPRCGRQLQQLVGRRSPLRSGSVADDTHVSIERQWRQGVGHQPLGVVGRKSARACTDERKRERSKILASRDSDGIAH